MTYSVLGIVRCGCWDYWIPLFGMLYEMIMRVCYKGVLLRYIFGWFTWVTYRESVAFRCGCWNYLFHLFGVLCMTVMRAYYKGGLCGYVIGYVIWVMNTCSVCGCVDFIVRIGFCTQI